MAVILIGLLASASAATATVQLELQQIAEKINAPHGHGSVDLQHAVIVGNAMTVDVVSTEPLGSTNDATATQVRHVVCAIPALRTLVAAPSIQLRFNVIAPDLMKPVSVPVRAADCDSAVAPPAPMVAPSAKNETAHERLEQRANARAVPTRPVNPLAGGLVYLECTTQQHWTNQDARTVHWQITLNEAAGTVDYNALDTGDRRVSARFTQDKVFFIGFELSRIDLTIRREFSGTVESGTCRLATSQPRAF